MRLDKYISASSGLSRREAAKAAAKGRVAVGGETVRDGAVQVSPDAEVTLDGVPLVYEEFIYIMMHKPSGYITATEDARPGERVVTDLLPPELMRRGLFPVGRLDRDTTGLLIVTNDGASAHRALSPKSHVAKTYAFTCSPPLTDEMIRALEAGVDIGERDGKGEAVLTAPAVIDGDTITVTEGKFHQIKRMFHAVGSEITSLSRVSFAGIELDGTLAPGEWRRLTDGEISLFTRGGASCPPSDNAKQPGKDKTKP